MDHTIAVLVRAEQGTTNRDHHDRQRMDAISARARRNAARGRVLLGRRIRAALAGALHRAAESIDPPRCVGSPLAVDHS